MILTDFQTDFDKLEEVHKKGKYYKETLRHALWGKDEETFQEKTCWGETQYMCSGNKEKLHRREL